MSGVRVVRSAERTEDVATPGMVRQKAIEVEGLWAGTVHTEAGRVSAWHHHGDYATSIYVMTGVFRMEFGPDGGEAVDAVPGDFIYVPPRAIHREGNPTDAPSSGVVVRAGKGDLVFNVDGPDPG